LIRVVKKFVIWNHISLCGLESLSSRNTKRYLNKK